MHEVAAERGPRQESHRSFYEALALLPAGLPASGAEQQVEFDLAVDQPVPVLDATTALGEQPAASLSGYNRGRHDSPEGARP